MQAGSSTQTSGAIRAIVKCTVGLGLVVFYAASSAGLNNEVMNAVDFLIQRSHRNIQPMRS